MCVLGGVRACVRACARACVRVCVCVCVHVCDRETQVLFTQQSLNIAATEIHHFAGFALTQTQTKPAWWAP